MDIMEFRGDNRYLSNFFPASFVWNNTLWPNAEVAYQAAKATSAEDALSFMSLTAGQAKRHGREIKIREDWDEVKFDLMRDIVRAKFVQNPELRDKLLATGTSHIEEGNNHNDRIWGVCPPGSSQGQNWLGKILMEIREDLRTA